ncbi:MAG: Crp/Fnr family transcriptional regulator [Alphaproteobacteria bacterium]
MKISRTVALLQQSPLFAQVDAETLNVLAFSAQRFDLVAQEVVFSKGDETNYAVVILSGEVEMVSGTGNASRTDRFGPGMVIGEMSLLAGRRADGTLTAVKTGEGLKINRELFDRVSAEFPELPLAIRKTVLHRLAVIARDFSNAEAVLRVGPDAAKVRSAPQSEHGPKAGANRASRQQS